MTQVRQATDDGCDNDKNGKQGLLKWEIATFSEHS